MEKIKKINKSRGEIVTKNFFKYLSKKGISQKKYAEDNGIDESTISKWKSMKNYMNLEQVYQAAKYFRITVNELYYTKEELDRILPVGFDAETEETIYAKRVAFIEDGLAVRGLHTGVILTALSISLILFIVTYLSIHLNKLYLLIPIILCFLMLIVSKFSTVKKGFVLNIYSDVFYNIENDKNQYYKFNIIIRMVCILSSLYYLFYFGKRIQDGYCTIMFIISLISLISSIINMFKLQKALKKEVYYLELNNYWFSMFHMCGAFILVIECISLSKLLPNIWILIIVSIVDLIIRITDFCIVSKKYSEYKVKISVEKGRNFI